MTVYCSKLNLMSAPDYLKTALLHIHSISFDTDKTLTVQAQRQYPLLAQSGRAALKDSL